MTYTLTRTSMALDGGTLAALKELAKLWGVSKAEVMRRAVHNAQLEVRRNGGRPSPTKALDWLQEEGGLSSKVAEEFRDEVKAEREATSYWWQ